MSGQDRSTHSIRIERLGLRVQGIAPDVMRTALEGLDVELARRLGARGLDSARWRDLAATIRLPAISAGPGMDAENLRARIADGLVDWLGRAAEAQSPAEET